MRRLGRLTAVTLSGAAAAAVAGYRHHVRPHRERLASVASSAIDSPFGRVEYAEAGVGPPVLLVHGVLGGCDFGVDAGRVMVPSGHRIIAPSRFGFLGSPMPADPTAPAQADAFAALLDHLGLQKVSVLGFSAGSTSSLELALRHPERVSRLVLISPNAPHSEPVPAPPRALAPVIFTDPVFWLMRRLAPARLDVMAGTPEGFTPTPREKAELVAIIDSLFPVGPRATGTIYDAYLGNPSVARCAVERIAVPTLVVAAEDDTLAPYPDTRAMAERIPGARLVTVRRGGHVLTHLDAAAMGAVEQFLAGSPEPAPPAVGAAMSGGA
jgi:pimeloyl-ACP methyl ester carboxylesterase